LANAPGSFEANHQLGEFCYHAGHYRDAIPMFETAFQIDPANRGNEYDLAVAQKEAGNFAASRVHAQNLLAHENNANLHSLLGDLDEQTGDSLGAVREYELAVRLDPSEQNYFKWGSELLLHRAVQPAAEVFAKGSAAYPKSARMLAAMGAALFAGGRYDEAAQRLCDASDLNPADSAPYIFLARIDEVAPAPLACVEPKLHRFLDLQPDNARANFYYAMAVWKRQKASDDPRDLQRVEGLLTKATTVDPNYGEAWLQFGILYFIERNYEKAIGFYTKAIEADPQLSEAHYRLGLAYERTAEPAKAKQQFHLHDQIEKQQAAAVERQRSELKQFLVVLGQRPGNRPPN
jgi:tetratricopeptide (TPR) repeat protein